MIRIKWTILIVMILFSVTASAEFYRYRDENGNIVYTDDITRVPRDQQPKIRKYNETQSTVGDTRQETQKEEASQPSAETEGLPATESPEGTQPESSEATAATDQESSSPTPDTKGAGSDLAKEKMDLDKRKQELDSEYQSLLKEKEALNRKGVFRTKEAAAVYNSKVADLNQRIDSYEKKKEAFNTDVAEYNKRVKSEIEAMTEKKQGNQ